MIGGFLYAIEFGGGRIKVGATRSPERRPSELRRQYKAALRRQFFAPCVGHLHVAERVVIARCAKLATRRLAKELFAGIGFGEAVTIVRQMASREFEWRDYGECRPVPRIPTHAAPQAEAAA